MSCPHKRNYISSYYTLICADCGRERSGGGLNPEPTFTHMATLNRSYSRPERWKSLIYKLTGFHNGPNVTDPVWAYLEKLKPFKAPQQILSVLRKSPLRNKHYQSIFVFTKIFAPEFKLPSAEQCKATNVLLKKYFECVFTLWNRYRKEAPFFSYNWLIEQGIHYTGHTEFLPFLKKLLCKRRRQRYAHALSTLYETHVESQNREPQDNHSPSATDHSETPRNRRGPPSCPHPRVPNPCRLGSKLDPVCMLKALRDAARKC